MDVLSFILHFQASANHKRRKDLYTLPPADLELLERLGYKEKLAEVDDAILANAEFLKQIVANPEIFGHDVSALQEPEGDEEPPSQDLPVENHTHPEGQ